MVHKILESTDQDPSMLIHWIFWSPIGLDRLAGEYKCEKDAIHEENRKLQVFSTPGNEDRLVGGRAGNRFDSNASN